MVISFSVKNIFSPLAIFLIFTISLPLILSIFDPIFSIFYYCSSITLFKLNLNLTKSNLMKSRFFSKENGHGHGHGHRVQGSDGDSSLMTTGSSSEDYPFFNLDTASINENYPPSPFTNSPWSSQVNIEFDHQSQDQDQRGEQRSYSPYLLLGSLVREEGHIYSLAASNDLLYTGSDSKNIRVWKNQKEFAGFKSNSGLVKTIVIANNRIFTGHQDGKIRLWKISSKNASHYKRVGTLPKFTDYVKSSMRPSNYVEIRRHRNIVWLKHFDAISCLSLNEDESLLYSASWDKTFKVWRISDSKCLESVTAHDDAVNSIVAGFDGVVFTGSADGTVKVWRRETQGKGTKHFFSQTLLKQECAVTALALNPEATVIYSGSSDGYVNLWERQNHLSHGGVLKGHKLAVLCLTTAGSLVISGSADMGICVWRRLGSDHIWLSLLTGHTGPVKCLAAQKEAGEANNSGETWILYSGSLDKSMKIWQISENAPPMAWNGCDSSMPVFSPAHRSSRLSIDGMS